MKEDIAKFYDLLFMPSKFCMLSQDVKVKWRRYYNEHMNEVKKEWFNHDH